MLPRLVLLPGLHGTGALFAPLVAALPRGTEPIVVEYPTHLPLDYRELDSWVRAALPIDEPYLIVAESFSGPLAVELAATRPPGLVGLVLAASFVRSPVATAFRLLVHRRLFKLRAPAWLVRRYLAGEDAPPALVSEVQDILAGVHPDVLAARVRAVLSVDATAALARCPVPIVYLVGTRDRLIPRAVPDQLRAVAPDLRVEWIEAPHLVLQRAPAAVCAALAATWRA